MEIRANALVMAGWAVTIAVILFMLRDLIPDVQQAPWVVKANARLGIPANVVLLIGIAGLLSPLLYALPWTSVLGAILLTGFLGGAAFVHISVNGSLWDIN